MSPICLELEDAKWQYSAYIPDEAPVPSPVLSHSVCLEDGADKYVEIGEQDSLNLYANNADMIGMSCVPTTMSDYLKERFRAISNVRAVLVGESNGVHHVWVMLDEWTQAHRKAVYAVQRDILQKVKGFNFDFYVVDIPRGSDPSEMVSGIPVIYQRT